MILAPTAGISATMSAVVALTGKHARRMGRAVAVAFEELSIIPK
jgi:hypothetical protein